MAEPAADSRRTARPLVAAALAAAMTLVALWPYTGVIRPGEWSFVVVAMVAVIGGAGTLLRSVAARMRAAVREALVVIAQLAVVAIAATVLLGGETALWGFVPTESTVQLIGGRVGQAVDEIVNGAAPLTATPSLAALLGLAFAVVAVIVDLCVAHRMVIVTIVLTTMVGVMPMIVSFGGVNVAWFLMHAAMVVVALRFTARQDVRAPRQASLAITGAISVAAVVSALLFAPGIPVSIQIGGAPGPQLSVSADLRLGEDLRRQTRVEVMNVVTTADRAPYLRIATLSRFDGEVWRPDDAPGQTVEEGFGPDDWGEAIDTEEDTVTIQVRGISSARLPVPYAAEKLIGLDGDWQTMPLNRTVVTETGNAGGQDYTVTATTAIPTLEQIRASSTSGLGYDIPAAGGVPDVIGQTAREVTAGETNDYDRLIALQNWFRAEFDYSLDAPVDEGFDGTGTDAVVTFLERRTGYCVHFAGAFALMAQTMGMPVRIVVGYLPGTLTDDKSRDGTVYVVRSDQLHAWPEVYFAGIGWIAFEPTATLGVPTAFLPAVLDDEEGAPETAAPTTGPIVPETVAPEDPNQALDAGSGADASQRLDAVPVLGSVVAILVVLLLPAAARLFRRAGRLRRARDGDAIAAWTELTDTMIDLGLPVHAAQTARARTDDLVRTGRADAASLAPLVSAVERASYAREGGGSSDVSAPLRSVLESLPRSVDRRSRLMARVFPASLFVRPTNTRAARRLHV